MSVNNGFKGTQADGGECMRAIAYLASWKGPVKEEDDPYGAGICNYARILRVLRKQYSCMVACRRPYIRR